MNSDERFFLGCAIALIAAAIAWVAILAVCAALFRSGVL